MFGKWDVLGLTLMRKMAESPRVMNPPSWGVARSNRNLARMRRKLSLVRRLVRKNPLM